MKNYDIGFAQLEEAMAKCPLDYPVGFFLQDIESSPCASGGFLWYKSEADLLRAVKDDLFSVFDRDSDATEIVARLSAIASNVDVQSISDNEFRYALNDCLAEANEKIEFLGTFKQLCLSPREWESDVRKQYREYANDDSEDLSEDVLQAPIAESERVTFAEYIARFRL